MSSSDGSLASSSSEDTDIDVADYDLEVEGSPNSSAQGFDQEAEEAYAGKTQTSISSFRNLLLTFSSINPENRNLKSSSRKCFEHTCECFQGAQCARFSQPTSFIFFFSVGRLYHKKIWM